MTDQMNACSCITCSDQALEMTVVAVDADTGLASCADGAGVESDVDTTLVAPVAAGARLMVHAGTAIALAPSEVTS